MKNLGAFLVGMSLVAGSALAANPVTSVNIVGFSKITCPRGGYVLVTTAFESIAGTALKSLDVFGTSQLPAGTVIYAWDQLKPSGAGYWQDSYNAKNGWETNINYKAGMGFWIFVPPGAAQPSYDVVLAGQVPMQSVSSNMVYDGYAMLGYPYTSSMLWTNTDLAKKSPNGTVLYWWDTSITNYQQNSKSKGSWVDPNMVITETMGFWLYNPTSVALTNVEVRPYNP
ncbi:MAG: hypothetical protein WCI03_04650 [bacterium]|jgi:hypothetical protein